MTKREIQKAERLAAQSQILARRALAKSDELQTYLSLLDYKAGKINKYKNAAALMKKIKRA